MVRLPDFSGNWTLKVIALVLAVLLWAAVKGEEPTRYPVPDVPILVELDDPDYVLAAPPDPPTVRVVFTGPVRELARLALERPTLVVPIERVQDTVEVRSVRTGWVRLEGGLERTRAEDIQPPTVRLTFERAATRIVPIEVVTQGELREGLSLNGSITVQPTTARISGARREVERIRSVRLRPIDLSRFVGPSIADVPIDTAGLGAVHVSPVQVSVEVPVGPTPPPAPEPDSIDSDVGDGVAGPDTAGGPAGSGAATADAPAEP